MSSMAMPKEQQTAYQRWEMSSFAADGEEMLHGKTKQEEEAASQKIAQLYESVRKEAYTAGMQEGFAVGMAKARECAEEDRQNFVRLMQSFEKSLSTADEKIAENLLALALDIAKAMVKTKLKIDPTSVIPVVQDAIHYLPHVQKPARITVNHEDAQLLRAYLGEELSESVWQVQEDDHIERGGCTVETGANQIDATNEVRWKRISESLGQDNGWLLP